MTKAFEAQLERMTKKDISDPPDFDAMWTQIENRLSAVPQTKATKKPINFYREKAIPITIAASLVLALPAIAAVSGGWSELWNGKSSLTAIENGLGERLNQTVTSSGIPFTLNGVVTDDQNMNLLFSMDMSDIPAFDAVTFEKKDLSDETGKVKNPQIQMKSDATDRKIFGLLTTQNNLKNQRKSYRMSLQNLVFYKYSSTVIDLPPETSLNKRVQLAVNGYSSLEITSIIREGNVFTIRYKIDSTLDQPTSGNPHLILKSGSTSFAEKISTVLPSDSSDVIVRQSTFDISDSDLKQAHFEFSVLKESEKRVGTWDFAFAADGKKASQAMFSKKLDPVKVANDSDMTFTELIITPLEIRLVIDKKNFLRGIPSESDPLVRYDKKKLLVGDYELDGNLWMTEDDRWYLRFESPVWYKDWSKVPMQLILSEKEFEERAAKDQLIKLTAPSTDKQTTAATMRQFPVDFTYYRNGNDLIIESSSSDPLFGSIVQTYIDHNGNRLYAEMNPTPPGGNGTNKKLERYPNIPDGDLMLNPFLYHWFDPSKTIQIPIN